VIELRCDNHILFGRVIDGLLDVKCRSNRCGAATGVVVIHRFDIHTGRIIETKRFKDPAYRKGVTHGI
jgi:hypothetical protein